MDGMDGDETRRYLREGNIFLGGPWPRASTRAPPKYRATPNMTGTITTHRIDARMTKAPRATHVQAMQTTPTDARALVRSVTGANMAPNTARWYRTTAVRRRSTRGHGTPHPSNNPSTRLNPGPDRWQASSACSGPIGVDANGSHSRRDRHRWGARPPASIV